MDKPTSIKIHCLRIGCTCHEGGECKTRKEVLEKIKKEIEDLPPMGVSQWAEYGRKYGYMQYFEKIVRDDLVDELIKNLKKNNS